MKISSKNYYSFLFIIFIYLFCVILFLINYNGFKHWESKVGFWLFVVVGFFFLIKIFKEYLQTFTLSHRLRIDNKRLIFDNKIFMIENYVNFRLRHDFNNIFVKLCIGDKIIFNYINFNPEEIDRFFYLIKPYLKKPKIVDNINFFEIRLFKEGFFIRHNKYYYDFIDYFDFNITRNRYGIKNIVIMFHYKNKLKKKCILFSQENIAKLIYIRLILTKEQF